MIYNNPIEIFIIGKCASGKTMMKGFLQKLLEEYEFDTEIEIFELYSRFDIKMVTSDSIWKQIIIEMMPGYRACCNDTAESLARIIEYKQKKKQDRRVDICAHYLPRDLVNHIRKYTTVTPFFTRLQELTGHDVVVNDDFIYRQRPSRRIQEYPT